MKRACLLNSLGEKKELDRIKLFVMNKFIQAFNASNKFLNASNKSIWLTGISIFFGTGFLGTGVFAQAYIGQVDYKKTMQPAASIRLPYNTGSVDGALKDYMLTRGYKKSESGGLLLFRGVPLDSMDTDGSDLYFMSASVSRKEKDITVLNLLPVKKNQDLMVRTLADSMRLDKARLFLDSLAIFTDAYNTRLQVGDHQEMLKKAQKKMNDLLTDQSDLQNKLRKFQTDLDQNKSAQTKAVADLQANLNADDDTKKKSQKKVSKLIDEQGSLEKKIRNTQLDLDQNKVAQGKQQTELDKQQQGLDAVKARENK